MRPSPRSALDVRAGLGPRTMLCLLMLVLTFGLALTAPAPARAQAPGVMAAPVAFQNQTDTTLEIESESITDNFGIVTPLKLTWTLKPGQYSWLARNNEKIYATKFTYRVKTPGRSSSWACTSNGPAANGSFTVAFSSADLRTHLGVVAGNAPPPLAPFPPPAAGPTQDQVASALVKITIAAVAHRAAAERAKKPDATLGDAFAEGLARGIRNAATEGALRDLFPRLSPRQAADIQLLIGDLLDGRLNYGNLDQQAAKQRLVTDMRSVNPDLADAAVVADFVYAIYQASRRK